MMFLAVAIPYALAPVYRFPPPRTFSGAALWNPYAHLTGTWQRANAGAYKLMDQVIAVDPASPEAALAKSSLESLKK